MGDPPSNPPTSIPAVRDPMSPEATGNPDVMATVAPIDMPPPHAMQPQETSSVSVEMGTAAWNPMPEWAGTTSMHDISTMTESAMIGSQTQYYSMEPPMTNTVMTDSGSESTMQDPLTTTTAYGIRIGASGSPTLSSSTTVFTTYLYSTYTSHSDVFTSSYPITSTEVTLVPMSTGNLKPIMPIASTSSRPNVGLIVGVVVSLLALLIAVPVAVWILVRRRRQRQRGSPGGESEFFPKHRGGPFSSDSDSERGLSATTSSVIYPVADDGQQEVLDQLDLAGPPLQPESGGFQAASSVFLDPGAFLRNGVERQYTMDTPAAEQASCNVSIVDMPPHSPALSNSSSATRQQELANEVEIMRQEISVLEARGSAQRDVEQGYVEEAGPRVEDLYSRIRELEREQAALRLAVEMGDTEYPPPDYATTEG
ncbi:hypothetical protein C8R44DRAFT_724151 [Mycena epipterygia]|nr:hypothetical protein C8R44DRAFT_724151 [Mycena epipterygia]